MDDQRLRKTSNNTRFDPVCECGVCCKQYRSVADQDYEQCNYLRHLDSKTASSNAETYAKSILKDVEFLRYCVNTFGDTILKRWRRRMPSKRKELLIQVDSTIYPTNAPLIDLATSRVRKPLTDQHQYRHAYLLPFLNLQSLSQDWGNLVNLLHYRTAYHPDSWVIYDSTQVQAAWDQLAITETYADGCIVLHGSEYGLWKPFDLVQIHSGYAYGAPRGLFSKHSIIFCSSYADLWNIC